MNLVVVFVAIVVVENIALTPVPLFGREVVEGSQLLEVILESFSEDIRQRVILLLFFVKALPSFMHICLEPGLRSADAINGVVNGLDDEGVGMLGPRIHALDR